MIKISKVVLLLMVVSSLVFAQEVEIKGVVPNSKNSSEVWFCRSIDGNPTHYGFMYDKAIVKNGEFRKSFYVQAPNVITIAPNKNVPKIYLVCDKDDSIKIEVNRNSGKELAVNFEGSNAKGQKIFYESPLFRGAKLDVLVDSVLKKASSLREAKRLTEKVKSHLFRPLDSLYQEKEVSTSFYELIKAQGDAQFLSSIGSVTEHYLNNSDANRNSVPLNDSELKELQTFMYQKYDPFSPYFQNIDQVLRSINAKFKCRLIAKGALAGEKHDLGLWKRPSEKSYAFAPEELQHLLMAINLMFNRYFEMNEVKADAADFALFKKIFPNSPYVPHIAKYFEKEGDKVEEVLPSTFAFYEKEVAALKVKGVEAYEGLSDLIKARFPKQAVFVDIWASWCRPCKEEFAYSESLSSFLDKHKIALLYVSIDSPVSGEKWVNDIEKYKLGGFHYFATNNIGPSLSSLLNENVVGIPRYLLFNERGELVDGNAPKPSEEEKLFTEIIERLNQ